MLNASATQMDRADKAHSRHPALAACRGLRICCMQAKVSSKPGWSLAAGAHASRAPLICSSASAVVC